MSKLSNKRPTSRSNAVTNAAPEPAPILTPTRGFWQSPWPILVLMLLIAGGTLAFFLYPHTPESTRMIRVPGGKFIMGSEESGCNQCDEKTGLCRPNDNLPLHEVELSDFWLDETPVTNAQFRAFVEATGYVTRAEILSQAERQSGRTQPASFVFRPRPGIQSLKDHSQWWAVVEGASWRHPDGPESNIDGKDDHPVVQVCWEDADAYALWAGKRLPTEAEFEYAARGGLAQKPYAWGDELTPDGKWMANIWQGEFPYENTKADGYTTTSPVKSFPPNAYGLYDMSGNVWQWCADWYRPDYYAKSPKKDPRGPDDSYDPAERDPYGRPSIDPETGRPIAKHVQRGGSFLCSDLYCKGYLPGSRGKGQANSAANHIGFRCAK
jgi:formylglycine-generating enzyme required for sulfatase activity